VTRLQDLRGTYGIKAPAPICAETAEDDSCQVVQAPAGSGRRLVPERVRQEARTNGEGEIRLTYRELSALIEDAIKSIR
jgi:hypothetical protein